MAWQRDANITNTALNHILDTLVIIYTDQGNVSGFFFENIFVFINGF